MNNETSYINLKSLPRHTLHHFVPLLCYFCVIYAITSHGLLPYLHSAPAAWNRIVDVNDQRMFFFSQK